ncbi:MAG: T9SS type A sorting domain-containing protein [Bacteroidota bacterium]
MKLKNHMLKKQFAFVLLCLLGCEFSFATSRISIASGDWNASATWSPSGSPSPTDNITIATGHTVTVSTNQTVHHVTVNSGATLTWSTNNTLSITGNFMVNGTVSMNGGNVALTIYGLPFTLGSTAVFSWDPGTNMLSAATLFTNGIEAFAPGSKLIIKKWYSFSVPLTSVVTGNFGNLELNSYNGINIPEWNQNNGFQTHQVTGTLTIDKGWITLDKSGTISNTTIGRIILKNVNSTFYAHNGTHPSSFALNTSSITNNGGNFYGINDGNGSINLHVTGNFSNYGSVKIINNSGIAGVSNGNAILTVDSTYVQSGGDTRIIYNVSTTNSGLFTANFMNINLTGGIFMGQSACRTAAGLCSMNVSNDLIISFLNSTDKFRGTSISSIGANINAVQFNLNIGGNLIIYGVLNSEFTSSAAAGIENVTVNGTTTISGSTTSFNYGAPSAAHGSTMTLNGNVSVTGGIIFLSRNNGAATISINNNFNFSAGQITLKGGDGAASMTVAGNYTQSGGQYYIHNNSTVPSSTPCSMTVLGGFTHTSGTFSFDSNSSNASANHQLIISGASFTVGGNSVLTHAGAGTSTSFGILNFNRSGIINYSRNNWNINISQVKQLITQKSIVKVISGNFVVPSSFATVSDMVKVEGGATFNLMGQQVQSTGLLPLSAITLDSNATLITQRAQGFYDGTPTACINSNMGYHLHPNSIVEYNSNSNQVLTGINTEVLPLTDLYGILKINMQGTAKAMMSMPVIVRTKLILSNGEVNLGGNALTINSGATNAITRTSGYINSEMSAGIAAGTIVWKNMNFGFHEFPFGTNATTFLPVQFFFMAGNTTDVSVSTYAASTPDNLPLPIENGVPVNFTGAPSAFTNTSIVDRWWSINAPNVTAGLVVTYRGTENTLDPSYQSGPMGFISWTGNSWNAPASTGTGAISGTGTVSSEDYTNFSVFTVGRQASMRTAGIIRSFTVEQVGEKVALNWSTELEQNSDYFIIERSSDEINFEEISREKAAGNSNGVLKYTAVDQNPGEGKAYYRIRQVTKDRVETTSSVEAVSISKSNSTQLSITSAGPNPFESSFDVSYKITKSAVVRFELSNGNGQMIHQSTESKEEGTHTFNFTEGSKLQPGIYFLKLIADGKTETRKLVRK